MGNAIYTDQMVCHDSLETCKLIFDLKISFNFSGRSHCDKSECVFVDKCNGAASKYVCMIIDPKFITYVVLSINFSRVNNKIDRRVIRF